MSDPIQTHWQMVTTTRAVRNEGGRLIAIKAEVEGGNVYTFSPGPEVPQVGERLVITVAFEDDDVADRILAAATDRTGLGT